MTTFFLSLMPWNHRPFLWHLPLTLPVLIPISRSMQQLKNNCHHQNNILILTLYPSKEAHVGADIDIQRNFFGLRNFDGEGDENKARKRRETSVLDVLSVMGMQQQEWKW